MIRAGIIGATGYAGAELLRLLLSHPEVRIASLGSKTYQGRKFSEIYRNFGGIADLVLDSEDMEQMSQICDVIFTATPQGFCAAAVNEEILSRVRVIDLSADFRLKEISVYESWYGITHASPRLVEEAVYGLCEIHREQIRTARLIANPGCYTTCSILSLYPAVKEGLVDPASLIVDALSGVSGAGAGAKKENLFCEVAESVKPYGVAVHRHTPEIEAELSLAAGKPVTLNFTPHLIPVNRGILATCYANLKEKQMPDGTVRMPTEEEIREVYARYYGKERFVRLLPEGVFPETRFVEYSNYLDIGLRTDPRTNRLIVVGAIDNLVKGAAGQAVQNMNLLFGFEEQTGLTATPSFP